jgi:hypothetical protein
MWLDLQRRQSPSRKDILGTADVAMSISRQSCGRTKQDCDAYQEQRDEGAEFDAT